MIPDLDIYRSAKLLAKWHAKVTPIEVTMRVDAILRLATWTVTGLVARGPIG